MLPLPGQYINLDLRLMVNFEGHRCSFSQKGCQHLLPLYMMPVWFTSTCTTRSEETQRTPGHTAALGRPRGLPQIGGFSRWIPKLCAFAIMPRYKNLDLQDGISSLLFPAHIADLSPLLFRSFLFPSLFLYIFFFLCSLLFATAAEFHISGKSINVLFTRAPHR